MMTPQDVMRVLEREILDQIEKDLESEEKAAREMRRAFNWRRPLTTRRLLMETKS